MLLEVRDITVHYGKSTAVQGVSLGVDEGAIVSIIGANGSGKTTLLRAVAGLTPVSAGGIYFRGEKVDDKTTKERVRLGITVVPEGRQLFPYLSVLDNLRLGATLRKGREVGATLEEVCAIFPRLKERSSQMAGTLSGGEQQMLAIGRALMAKPVLLCMDEPSLGLSPLLVEQLGEVVRDINQKGVTVLLVEQNVNLAFGVATYGYVLQVGRTVMEGDTATLRASAVVKKAYLGERADSGLSSGRA